MKNIWSVILFLPLFISAQNETYRHDVSEDIENPILDKYLADPFVHYENGTYYLFATGGAEDGNKIPIYSSTNLKNWKFEKGAVTKGDTISWNFKHFWAPEVHKFNDTYYLYYTASPKISPRNSNNKVGVATSENILGPYTDHGPVIPHGSIDGHPFLDDDNQLYFYFTVEQLNSTGLPQGGIYAYKMSDPMTITGKPKPIITAHNWQEGAFILKKDTNYWITYSKGAWKNETYHVKLAKATHPFGPFELLDEPLLQSNAIVKGPGHNSLFKDKDGNDWIVYHGWDINFTARYPRLDRLYWKDDVLICNGPTGTK